MAKILVSGCTLSQNFTIISGAVICYSGFQCNKVW